MAERERPPRSPCLGGRMSPDRLVGAFVFKVFVEKYREEWWEFGN